MIASDGRARLDELHRQDPTWTNAAVDELLVADEATADERGDA